ncbi:bifunctional 2-polyprenyl-6-hydroxyphenol methylase/3-demethylubiquinol 3-O-methyltransferase UbiG [Streptomyces sp. GC420]|uniref:class I SAM-dependent methyltransferase n=1 Tax=Streptomyces sp. GC420 TaxID=2697568 RepID=UPI001414DC4B|nr:class I SAM-dependent methyltransferase [Streptomyces sp. GC420]NBM15664.1 methyltransferase domain-containing protein [Streptomyces sp. GC420]
MPRTPHEGEDAVSAPEPAEPATSFEWTQYPGHGPAEEFLGRPATALELGCGTGTAAAHLAGTGVKVTALDLVAGQIAEAREQWEGTANLGFLQADALDHLAATDAIYDAVYSIWGAVWFIEPGELLPLIARRLAPGGVLAFSQAEPDPGRYGPTTTRGRAPDGSRISVRRWNLAPETWAGLLDRHGFTHIGVHIHPAPHPGDMGTLMARAHVL